MDRNIVTKNSCKEGSCPNNVKENQMNKKDLDKFFRNGLY